MGGYSWIQNSAGGVPSNAVQGGVDKDGGRLYVGRAKHNSELLPAKVVPNQNCAFISFAGSEIRKNIYEILVNNGSTVSWQACQNGDVAEHAVQAGLTSNNERLYVGRVNHDSTQTPGKVHPAKRTCYISYGGRELTFSSYEVLVLK